ncbi:MAG TPA: ATP-binding cassette domain-containing protein [Acidimicrobiales bacterium]|nr:ATP-binding cassette domain-containing protein [Acidimicrobiales bacterium]
MTVSPAADGGGQMPAAAPSPVLEARGISKAFGHVQALSGVDLDLLPGEILALVGDNGAGKSTLIKILSGVLQPDTGEILVNGQRVQLHSPVAARSVGIETVYQELAVIPMMDITENLFLGREERVGGWLGRALPVINRRAMQRQAREQLRSLKINLGGSLRQRVDTLSGGQRQGVAVSRAVLFGRRIVILDEPTAALGVRESRAVLELVQTINGRGMSIILISHNMPQVFELTNRILVLRAGRRAGVVRTAETDMEQVVRLMTGAEIQTAV